VSWSGGKDSALALEAVRADPQLHVAALLTTVTSDYERVSIHGVRRALLQAQALALGLPLLEMRIAPRCSNDEYERALSLALVELRARYPSVRRLVFGDLFLEDVRRYREDRLAALGYTALFPLWGKPTDALARDLVDRGYAARLVCVDTETLDARFAGRAYDERLLKELPATVDPCGERGEFHTFVSDGPGFSNAVAYEMGEVVLRDERFAYCDLLPA
jgi:uncharacterized protein (TIGR00290 family)